MSAPCYYGCFDVLTQRSDTSVRKRSFRSSIVCTFPKVMLWSMHCADLVIFACQQGWSGCGPFWRAGRNQTNYVACCLSTNGHAAKATTRFTKKCAPITGENEFSKLAQRSDHSSIQHKVRTTLKRKLEFQHSIFGVLVRTCVLFSTNQLPARATARFILKIAPHLGESLNTTSTTSFIHN